MGNGRVHWIPCDVHEPVHIAKQDDEPDWDVMRKYVDGYLEHVSVLYKGKSAHMYVNEEGLIHGLPTNPRATAVYFAAARQRGEVPELESPGIAGPAILLVDIPIEGYDFIGGM